VSDLFVQKYSLLAYNGIMYSIEWISRKHEKKNANICPSNFL